MYDVSWLVRNKVLHIRAEGEVTLNELKSGLSLMHVMVLDASEPVHCITDTRKLNKQPSNFSALLSAAQDQDYTGWTINIGDNSLGRKFTNLVTQVSTGRKVKTFTSIDDALDFLVSVDEQLSVQQSLQAGV